MTPRTPTKRPTKAPKVPRLTPQPKSTRKRGKHVPKAPKVPPQKPVEPNAIKSENIRPPHPGEQETIAERRRQVFTLRRIGASYPDIARKVGCSVSTAWEDVQAELTDRIKHNAVDAEALRTMELERCDAVMTALWSKVQLGDEKAGNTYLRAMQRRAMLLGLDAPTKIAPTTPDGESPYQQLAETAREKLAHFLHERTSRAAQAQTDAG